MPWSSFSECWALSQLFHSPLSLSSRNFLVPLHFLAIWVVSSASLRLLIFLPAILILACVSSSPAFLMRCSVEFSSVAQSCPTLCDPRNHSTPGLPVHQQLLEFTETHVHWVGDAIQPSHPLSSPSPPAPNPSQHQSLFQWVNSSHEVARVLEFQL